MELALAAGLSALVVVAFSTGLVARHRRRRARPAAPWAAHASVRLLVGQDELAQAVARAVRSEKLIARQVSGRLARYEGMTRESEVDRVGTN